ncbi:MAG: hypothetical protein R3F17_05330 [Planctomycetota bacterium]
MKAILPPRLGGIAANRLQREDQERGDATLVERRSIARTGVAGIRVQWVVRKTAVAAHASEDVLDPFDRGVFEYPVARLPPGLGDTG